MVSWGAVGLSLINQCSLQERCLFGCVPAGVKALAFLTKEMQVRARGTESKPTAVSESTSEVCALAQWLPEIPSMPGFMYVSL